MKPLMAPMIAMRKMTMAMTITTTTMAAMIEWVHQTEPGMAANREC
jgi:hypothetical protein